MIDPETRKAVYLLHQKGLSARKISRDLDVSRGAVAYIIREKGEIPAAPRRDKVELDRDLLQELYNECEGYKERVYEKLLERLEEEGKPKIGYSTLTRRLREYGIGESRGERCDRVPDEPGAEMQHDTTSYKIQLGGVLTKVIASLIYLRYCKRRYLKFYRHFNRFLMKCFLHEALLFWGYAAKKCIIDNTNLARLRGTGKRAVIVPEMESFAKRHAFEFKCHELGHANRKAGNEKSFHTVETNFLPGRRFQSLEDLNAQALWWATVKMDQRPVSKTNLIPAKAFEHEQSYLNKLPPYVPAPYLPLKRGIDQYGYVVLDTNYYWVPGEGRGEVKVLRYSNRLEIYQRRELVAKYPLAPDGVRNECFSPQGLPKPRYKPKNRKKPTAEEEKRLRALGQVVSDYLDFVLKDMGGRRRHQFIRELFALSRKMTPGSLCRAVERALKYGITSVETIRNIAHLQLGEDAAALPCVEVDESFLEREAYLEGHLSAEPDFSVYDDLLEADSDG
jgi:hypothetical protein